MFKKIRFIKNFGIYKDVKINDDQCFYQFNLIYGFNYSGKTTLSRIFRAMQVGELPDGFKDGSFEVERYNSSIINSSSFQKIEYLRVFNSDYVAKNVNFNESSVHPVLIVGEKNIELEEELQKLQSLSDEKKQEAIENNRLAQEKDKERNLRLTTVGRAVTQLNILGTSNFNSIGVRTMLPAVSPEDLKTAEELSSLIDLVKSRPFSRVQKASIIVPNINSVLDEIREILRTSVTRMTINALDENIKLRGWIEQGIEYHANYTTCQFCQNEIHTKRLEDLNSYFSESYKDLSQRISNVIENLRSMSISSIFPKSIDLYPDLQRDFDNLKDEIFNLNKILDEVKGDLIKVVSRKKENMSEEVFFDLSGYYIPDSSDLLRRINSIIEEHNIRIDNHSTEKMRAIEQIKRHYVYQESQDYDHIKASEDYNNFLKLYKKAEEEESKANSRIIEIKAELNNTKQGAENLNINLRQYFGKTDIEIRVENNFYKFIRENKEAKYLSDGERTAIAFAYFVTQLEEEALKNTKPIIYLDDPISSLDSNHIYNVLGIIKNKFNHNKVKQLFISTHNFEFFNLVKMWMSYYKEKQEVEKRTQYFLINRTGSQSQINHLPDLLKDHRSEYAYLISKVKEAVENPKEFEAIAVQSYIRKIMESYFLFRFNKAEFRKKGIDFIAENFLDGIPDAEVNSNILYEYMNEKCHSKSILLGNQFSEAAHPQIVQVWDIIVNALQVNDNPHYIAYYQ